MWVDASGDFLATLVTRLFQFEVCLEVHPELWRRAEVTGETEGRIRADCVAPG
jgi:hypothetical protein